MKYYFREWKNSDTEDNFFRWCVDIPPVRQMLIRVRLDRGEGKNLDLEVLPRERLEKERIT